MKQKHLQQTCIECNKKITQLFIANDYILN